MDNENSNNMRNYMISEDWNNMKNHMDSWILEKIGKDSVEVDNNVEENSQFNDNEQTNLQFYNNEKRSLLEKYQLEKLKETIEYAKSNSAFYNSHLMGIDILSFEDMEKIPFIRESDCDEKLLCVPQSQINRVVTLESSGTTGERKRVFFTEEDQELCIDFFHRGMKNLIDKKDILLILMPTKRVGSIGDLLRIGVERMGAKVNPHGPLEDGESWQDILEIIRNEKITSIVATPTQIEMLIDAYLHEIEQYQDTGKESFYRKKEIGYKDENWKKECSFFGDNIKEFREISLKSILLSAEYVSEGICEKANRVFGCKVFEHYGMTETGLGGAVSCYKCEGYHVREADLYFEIIDSNTGKVLEDGEWGEVVVTTLTRKAMPFIRYKTGDISRWIKKPCECGSYIKRLDKVKDRKKKKGEGFYVK